jgi:hypothetical protein
MLALFLEVQGHEDEYRRNKLVDELIYLWIDKDIIQPRQYYNST